MDCDRCDEPAIMHAPYSGAHLCESHFCESVERRVRRRIRQDGLIDRAASPENPLVWMIGLSGGKDSVVLTQILAETFDDDPRIELVCLTIHEGIAGYRDKSLDASVELAESLDIIHDVVTYEEEFDVKMDDVVDTDPEDMAACAYCGVFRRDILSQYAEDYGADLLLTGHNLDDEAQTALMNILDGDVTQIAKHFEASLGALDERHDQEAFIPRAKPLRDIPEKEVALYAHVRDLPVHMAECPHSSEAFRGEIQQLIYSLEDNHPGTRHSILSGYEELASIASSSFNDETRREEFGECTTCGSPTRGDICRKCSLLEAIHAT